MQEGSLRSKIVGHGYYEGGHGKMGLGREGNTEKGQGGRLHDTKDI